MSTFLLAWNPTKWDWADLDDALIQVRDAMGEVLPNRAYRRLNRWLTHRFQMERPLVKSQTE